MTIRLSSILRWKDRNTNQAQIEGHEGELRNDTYNINHAGIISKPSSGYALLMYFDDQSSIPHMIPHGIPALIPRCSAGETIIYDPDTGQQMIKLTADGIEISGNVTIKGSLTLERNNGDSGPVTIDGDVDSNNDVTISPS